MQVSRTGATQYENMSKAAAGVKPPKAMLDNLSSGVNEVLEVAESAKSLCDDQSYVCLMVLGTEAILRRS